MKKLKDSLGLLLLFFYPLLVVIITGWFWIPYLKPYLKECITFGLTSVIFLCFYLLLGKSRIQRWIFPVFVSILSFLAFIKLTFYYHYGVKLSGSALYVIFETNAQESSEFLSYYLNSTVIILGILLFIPWMLLYSIFGRKEYFRRKAIIPLIYKIVLLMGISGAILIIHLKFSEENIIYTSVVSYSDYQDTKEILKNTLAKSESDFIKNISSEEIPQTYVVVIGESTSRWHMQLYGYTRETNPLLSEIRDELIIFDNTISPNVHTILALDKILTFSNQEQANKPENASVVQLANQAGFTTYWLSNQRPVGLHENVSTLIGNAANQKYFLATDNYNSNIYDEDIFPTLENILKQKELKKIIFIHLIGTHSDYKKRYPKKFDYFRDSPPKTPFVNSDNENIVNEYDNAIRYNDYIVRNIIERVRKQNTNSYVMYFSDHGDELFDTMDLMGHNEYYGTKPMYEIPFIIWLSPEYKENFPEFKIGNDLINRKYNLEDFIYSFSDLSKIKFNSMDTSRSIFNTEFKERTRWIKEKEDYDKR